jgi:hypothetical protein
MGWVGRARRDWNSRCVCGGAVSIGATGLGSPRREASWSGEAGGCLGRQVRTNSEGDRGSRSISRVVVIVANGNDEPVYDVVVRLDVGVRGTFARRVGVLGPHEARELRISVAAAARSGTPAPDLGFTDSAGRSWLRVGHSGRLREISKAEVSKLSKESSGAYPTEGDHPTLGLGHTLEAQRGRRLP